MSEIVVMMACPDCGYVMASTEYMKHVDNWKECIEDGEVECPLCGEQYSPERLVKMSEFPLDITFQHTNVTEEVYDQAIAKLLSGEMLGDTNYPLVIDDNENYGLELGENRYLSKICVVEPDPRYWDTNAEYLSVCAQSGSRVDPPKYIMRSSETSNSGWDSYLDENFVIWRALSMNSSEDDIGIEYGASGPAYQGAYSHHDRIGVLKWIDGLVDRLNEPGRSLWL